MKLRRQLIFFAFSLCLCVSCVKYTDDEIHNYTAKLVLHSFISPSDSVIKVHVSTTKNIYGNLSDYPDSLPVNMTLVDGDHFIPFNHTDSSGFCYLSYRVAPGKTYKIIATCAGYPDATGTCTIPMPKAINMAIDTVTESFSDPYGHTYSWSVINLTFRDIAYEKNYYCVYGSMVVTNKNGTDSLPLSIKDNPIDASNKLLSDQSLDGQMMTTTFQHSKPVDTTIYSQLYKIYIAETDEHYYKFHSSLSNYYSGHNPFIEFSPVYSNIKGGYGIFCSYVKYEKIFRIK
jgi:hypothetical protein